MIGSNLQATRSPINWLRSRGIRGFKWQRFSFGIRNSGGVLQCAFFDTGFTQTTPPVPELCDRILYVTNTWKNLPAVGAATAFGNVGAGTYSSGQFLAFNTRPQPFIPDWPGSLMSWARVEYTNSNTTRCTPYMYFDNPNVLGSGQIYRPNILQCADFGSSFPLFSTGQIPNGTQVIFDIDTYIY